MHNATSEFTLGFYDPHSRRSVAGFADDGSPLWLTWRDAPAVALAALPGEGKTHLLRALVQGMREHVDVYVIDGKAGFDWDDLSDSLAEFDATGDLSRATRIVSDVAAAFTAEPPARPRLVIVDEASAFGVGRDATEFWHLVRHIALRGRRHHTTVLLASQKPTSLPRWFTDTATVTVAMRLASARDTVELGLEDAAAPHEFPYASRRLVVRDVRSGIVTGSTLQPSNDDEHVGCDCVARATALLAAHAEHAA